LILLEDAERIAEEFIHSAYRNRIGEERVIVDREYTVERDYGWFFVMNTVGFVRTRDWEKGLIGTGPLLVLRDGSGIVRFSSACLTPDVALAAYERDPGQFPLERP
jgi:Immunity protein 35